MTTDDLHHHNKSLYPRVKGLQEGERGSEAGRLLTLRLFHCVALHLHLKSMRSSSGYLTEISSNTSTSVCIPNPHDSVLPTPRKICQWPALTLKNPICSFSILSIVVNKQK